MSTSLGPICITPLLKRKVENSDTDAWKLFKAREFTEQLSYQGEDVQAGSSIHMWLSFSEFKHWSKDGINSSFVFAESIMTDFVMALADLVRDSCAPVFVSLCQQQFLSW